VPLLLRASNYRHPKSESIVSGQQVGKLVFDKLVSFVTNRVAPEGIEQQPLAGVKKSDNRVKREIPT
jgi:hypothetical protein